MDPPIFNAVGAAGGQFVTWVQQLSVISTLQVEWEAPVSSVLEATTLLNWDIVVLHPGCIAPISPLSKYIGSLLVICGRVHLINVHQLKDTSGG